MSTIQSARRTRLASLRVYLENRRLLELKKGNAARGLTTWIHDLDAILTTHGGEP